jgi:hypothetical protein
MAVHEKKFNTMKTYNNMINISNNTMNTNNQQQ